MRPMLIAVVAALVILSPSRVIASPTGNKLYEQCKSPAGSPTYWYDDASCLAYIQGFIEGAISFQELWANDQPKAICLPENVTAGQMRDVVVKYLEIHPERRHLPAMMSIMTAAVQAFPC